MDITLKHSKKRNQFVFVTSEIITTRKKGGFALVFKAEYVRFDPESQENTTLKTDRINGYSFSQWWFQMRVDAGWRIAKPLHQIVADPFQS